MKKLKFLLYGDIKCIALSDLKIPNYYAKTEIEGENKAVLFKSIEENGVKKPVIVNTYPGREGIIIDGVEIYKISKEIGIYDIPCYALYIPKELEQEYHYIFSIKCKEYSIEEIIENLKSKTYKDYFLGIVKSHDLSDQIFSKGQLAFEKDANKIPLRKHTFPLRYDDSHIDYLRELKKIMDVKSQNEAILKLIIEVVEKRIKI